MKTIDEIIAKHRQDIEALEAVVATGVVPADANLPIIVGHADLRLLLDTLAGYRLRTRGHRR